MRYSLFLLAALAGAAPAWAENRAVVIGNADYRNAPDLAGADTPALAAAMQRAGFRTAMGVDLTTPDMRRCLDLLAREDTGSGSRIVLLSGRFVSDGSETWFMGTEAGRSGPLGAGAQGVPLGLVTQLMAGAGKGSVLILGTDQQNMPHDQGLNSGIGAFARAKGVAVITGSPEAAANALRELAAGRSVARALAAGQGLKLMPGGDEQMIPARPGGVAPSAMPDPPDEDRLAWADAAALDTVRAYSIYLERFPTGAFAQAARERRAGLNLTVHALTRGPADPAQAEAALRLDHAAQLGIQRALARLGLDPGPVDGLIGLQTREALRLWQRQNRLDPTGYLAEGQPDMLRNQIEALDGAGRGRDFWALTGARTGMDRLRTYLRRDNETEPAYDGHRPLGVASNPMLTPQLRNEAAAWRWARRQDTAAAYTLYLERFPQGSHAAEARMRQDNMMAATQAARQQEAALGMSLALRRQIEVILRDSGVDPGPVDGKFSEETRLAIRRFQASHNLHVTGYLSRRTLGALLAGLPGTPNPERR